MIKLLLLFAFQIVSQGEMACVGSIQEMKMPEDVYIAGVEGEGTTTFAVTGQFLVLNGPGVTLLKRGSVQRVVRPEGRVHDPRSKEMLGTYYSDIGTVQIESVDQESAMARVLSSCQGLAKGDIVVPSTPKTAVDFSGTPSDDFSIVPPGPSRPILMAKNDQRELAAGQFCFIQFGKRDGVKPGDRFIVFREYSEYNSQDMSSTGAGTDTSYVPVRKWQYRSRLNSKLRNRALLPQVLGDIVVVEAGDGISTGKIVNSFSEIHLGDRVVKK